jgi:hypothetical protein
LFSALIPAVIYALAARVSRDRRTSRIAALASALNGASLFRATNVRFYAAAEAAVVLIWFRGELKRLSLPFAVVGLAFAPWLPILYGQLHLG